MKKRLITSIFLVGFLIVIGVVNNPYLTKLVIAFIAIVGMFEAKRLFDFNDDKVFYFLSLLSIGAVFVNPLFIGIFGVLSIGGYIAFYQKDLNTISIAFYPFLSLMILMMLYIYKGMAALGWLIVIVAMTDSLAYVIGKNFGKKFIKKGFCSTSPNKTWEGVIGGIISGSILGAFVGMVFYSFLGAVLISFIVSIFSVFGDLFESYLKRKAGVKDSGNILPGHGGILDRIDGYLFGAPLMWAMMIAMGNL